MSIVNVASTSLRFAAVWSLVWVSCYAFKPALLVRNSARGRIASHGYLLLESCKIMSQEDKQDTVAN